MKSTKGLAAMSGRLLCGAAIGAIAATSASAQSFGDEIVVTAQRQEQSVQDVPIAVSAFGGEDLASRQLETFQDIQFNIPNFAFSKSQFTTSSISIRGIGALAVGASTEPSTSVHINDVYIQAPRLFETEFFDVERLEILRGPQGTLFGRNATGGVINVITRKASTDGISGYADAEYGTYNSVKVQGALNLPLSDNFAVRIAGTTIQRDGYTTNLYDGSDIDDRNIYALRGSARWTPSDSVTLDLTASYMREDDSRMRSHKQACEAGPLQPLLGCDPNGPRAFDPMDLRATFFANTSAQTFGLATGNPAAAAYGLFSLASGPVNGQAQPTSLREVNQDSRPEYAAEESIFMMNFKKDFENWSFKLNGGWGNSKVASRMDFDAGVGPQLTRPAALCAPAAFGGLPAVCNMTGGPLAGTGLFPLSEFDVGITGPNGLVGVIGGQIQDRSTNYRAVDLSIGESDYWSAEAIINTDFDGGFNFLIGLNHAERNGYADYAVATTGLDYFAYTLGTLQAVGAGVPNAASTGYGLYTPYFWNDTDDEFLDSTSAFGEVYINITDSLKLTGGIRHNWDTKGVRDRGNLLESASSTNTGILAGTPPIVPFGTPSVRPLLDSDELTEGTPGAVNDFRVVEGDFNATTGRAVLQYTPNDNVQLYASWTRGFKPGGFNPRTNSALVPLVFGSEKINAYEAGIKSNLGGGFQANLTGFYYDYSGLQISRIVANTSVNDNIDAKVHGVEGEFVWRPTDRFIANLNASYLHTKVGDFAAIDVRNPTANTPGVDLIADITTGQNCVIENNGAPSLIGTALPGGLAAFNPLIASNYSICAQFTVPRAALGGANMLQAINGAFGTNYQLSSGIPTDATGNDLPGSPKFKLGGGVQYAMPMGKYDLTPRVDVVWQDDFYSNVFNTQQDLIDAYMYMNAQVTFGPSEGNWSMRFFMQNVTDKDAITGSFDVGQSAGNFQNLFILEPRRWGFGLNMTF